MKKILLVAFVSILLIIGLLFGGIFYAFSSFKDQLNNNNPNINLALEKQIVKMQPQNDFILLQGVNLWMLKALTYVCKDNSQPLFIVELYSPIFPFNEKNFKSFFDKNKINQNLSLNPSSEIAIQDIQITENTNIKTKSRDIPLLRTKIAIVSKTDNEIFYIDAIVAAISTSKMDKTVFIISGGNPQKFNPIVVKKFISAIQSI